MIAFIVEMQLVIAFIIGCFFFFFLRLFPIIAVMVCNRCEQIIKTKSVFLDVGVMLDPAVFVRLTVQDFKSFGFRLCETGKEAENSKYLALCTKSY